MNDKPLAARPLPWQWLVEACREWGWRHTAVGVAVGVVGMTFFNYGHIYHMLARYDGEPLLAWALWNVTQFGWPYVLAMRIADRAVDHGHPRVLAYGGAMAVVLFAGASVLAAPMGVLLSVLGDPSLLTSPARWLTTVREFAGLDAGMVASRLAGYLLCTAIYAQWRHEKAARARLHTALAARAERERQVQASRLLALQARVEPQFLFAALRKVRARIQDSADAAQRLLDDLIALLRAMQGVHGASASTVERELALIQAFARASETPGLSPPWLTLDTEPAARAARLAPLVLLPALRALTAPTPARQWRLSAACRGDRLRMRFAPVSPAADAAPPALDIDPLRLRLVAVHGDSAHLGWESAEGVLCLDVPFDTEVSTSAR